MRVLVPAAIVFLLAACTRSPPPALLGTLEWERIGVSAEASEPILRIEVKEGDQVREGTPILSLDSRRIDAQLAQAQAQMRHAEAVLAELRKGTRAETIDAARATLAGADATVANARRERERIADVRARGLVAQADLDRATTALRTAQAQAGSARANLVELLNGARIEDIEQAQATLAAAEATTEHLRLSRARLDVRAPRDGRIDALPFRLGDQPPIGAVVVSLLAGSAPYARVYVPASERAGLDEGAACRVEVEGVAGTFAATLRSIRSDPAFTPYYALAGDDASRLAFRAELVLTDASATALPAGLPLRAECAPGPPAQAE